MSHEELERVFHEVDITGTGVINYHEFIAATFPVEKYATRERMESLFMKFDVDGTHKLGSTTLKNAFTKLGHEMTADEIAEIMNEHDVDLDHELTYQEFTDMILDHM